MVEQANTPEPALDRAFAAVADPTRRAILDRLRSGPSTISELAQPFEVSFAAVSKHVGVLERAGLLRREVQGRAHWCHLEVEPLRQVADWAGRHVALWETRLDALAEHLGTDSGRAKS